jgi:hypothetical protein
MIVCISPLYKECKGYFISVLFNLSLPPPSTRLPFTHLLEPRLLPLRLAACASRYIHRHPTRTSTNRRLFRLNTASPYLTGYKVYQPTTHLPSNRFHLLTTVD